MVDTTIVFWSQVTNFVFCNYLLFQLDEENLRHQLFLFDNIDLHLQVIGLGFGYISNCNNNVVALCSKT